MILYIFYLISKKKKKKKKINIHRIIFFVMSISFSYRKGKEKRVSSIYTIAIN